MNCTRHAFVLAIMASCVAAGCGSQRRPLLVKPSELAAMPDAMITGRGVQTMSREEVIRCADMVSEVDRNTARLKAEHERIEQARAGLDAASAALESDRGRLDRRDAHAVETFNQRIAEQRLAVGAYNAKVAAHNAEAAADSAKVDDFNAQCANRSYDPARIGDLPEATRAFIAGHPNQDKAAGGSKLGVLTGRQVIYVRRPHPVGVSGFR